MRSSTSAGMGCAVMALALFAPPANGADCGPSELRSLRIERRADQVVVLLDGSCPPDVSVSDRGAPVRIVLDWAATRWAPSFTPAAAAHGVKARVERTASEEEEVSRLIVTASPRRYWVEVDKTRVRLVLKGVAEERSRAEQRSFSSPAIARRDEPLPPGLRGSGPLTEPLALVPREPPPVRVTLEAPPDAGSPPKLDDVRPAKLVARSPVVRAKPPSLRAQGAELPAPLPPEPLPLSLRSAPLPPGLPSTGPETEPVTPVPAGPSLPASVLAAREALARLADAPLPSRPTSRFLEAPEGSIPRRTWPTPSAESSAVEPVLVASNSAREPEDTAPPEEASAPPERAEDDKARTLARFPGASSKTKASKKPSVQAPSQRIAAFSPSPSASGDAPSSASRARPNEPGTDASPSNGTRSALAGAERPSGGARAEPVSASRPNLMAKKASFDEAERVLTYIGFRQAGVTSRVFVRIDARARFKVMTSPAQDTFVLRLFNTRVNVENNTRPLDTTFFPGPITLVQAKRIGTSVDIEVRLRSAARWQVKRIGTMVAVDFVAER